MEQKPIKRNENILKLSKEHHFSLLFCWKIRNGLKHGVTTERINMYVKYFWQHCMQPHFKEEEEILFVPLQDEMVKKATEQHKDIKRQVEELFFNAGVDTTQRLAHLADIVDNHVRYEERELFPYLEKQLSITQLKNIGKQLRNTETLTEEYSDDFWNNK